MTLDPRGFPPLAEREDTPTPSAASVVASFLARYLEDAAVGRTRDLAHYQACFPGHEETIRREYEALHEEGDGDGSPDGLPPRFGRYRVLSELGRGGQGMVLLAEDELLGRRVALKVLRAAEVFPGRQEEARFLREAALAARLDHEGICHVYDAGEENGFLYIAMRRVEGRTLAALLAERNQTEQDRNTPLAAGLRLENGARADLLKIFEDAARALHAAHQAGVVHRDIKPANIMITGPGSPVILDFGIARDLASSGFTLTSTGDLVGTPAYLAPEVLSAGTGTADPRIDIYALGVCLYEAVTGQRPFSAPTRDRLYAEIVRGTFPDPRRLVPEISRDLAAVIRTAMDQDPGRRYETALDLAEDLQRIRENRPVLARPAGPILRLRRWLARERAIAWSLAAVLLALAATAIISTVLLRRTEAALSDEATALAAESRARRLADERLVAWQRLADKQVLDDLERRSRDLWPARPERAPAMRRWIATAEELLSRKPEHERALAELRARARPIPEAELERLRRRLPHHEEAAFARQRIAFLEKLLPGEQDPRRRALIEGDLEYAHRVLDGLEARFAALPRFRLEDSREQWRFMVLQDLVGRLTALAEPEHGGLAAMRRRLETALTIRRRTIEEPARAWKEAIARVGASPRYEGLELRPQLGLIPLGPDAASGLEEFAEIETGIPARRDPASGRIAIGPETGMVFVLIPGGSFIMGAQKADPGGANYDPAAQPVEEPLHRVRVDAFLLSKYEMTQGQWLRVTGENPSAYPAGATFGDTPVVDLRHPVEQITWNEAREILGRLDMLLPTEAQWEYAARAGTTTRYWTGSDPATLEGAANLADLTCRDNGGPPGLDYLPWRDGYPAHAPVGSYRPNPFGLHDTMGNVGEWCRDGMGVYGWAVRPGDGLRKVLGPTNRVERGGDFHSGKDFCASARRNSSDPSARSDKFGVRPSRPLR